MDTYESKTIDLLIELGYEYKETLHLYYLTKDEVTIYFDIDAMIVYVQVYGALKYQHSYESYFDYLISKVRTHKIKTRIDNINI